MNAEVTTQMSMIEEQYEPTVRDLVPINRLTSQRQHQLLVQAEVVEYRRGEFVFREGEKDNFSYFLLEGELELMTGDDLIKPITGGMLNAKHALAQLQPRQMSARARRAVKILRVDRNLLDKLLALDGGYSTAEVEVLGIDTEEDNDWMTRMLQSELFERVPAANIQRIFNKMKAVKYAAGDLVLRQGDQGDFYYVIQEGRCEVTRQAANGKTSIKLAELGPGDTFGEEALVADSTRNATVRMLTQGVLMSLAKADFVELIKTPLLSAVGLEEGRRLVAEAGALWLDVRFPEEINDGGIQGSINHPLNTLRMHAERLNRSRPYVIYCDSGARSAAAAFLLSERGFDVHCLAGGLCAWGLLETSPGTDPKQPSSGAGVRPAAETEALLPVDDLELFADDSGDDLFDTVTEPGVARRVSVASLIPASQQSENEQLSSGLHKAFDATADLLDADVAAQALKAELARANMQLEEAKRLKQEADTAKLKAEQLASQQLKAERAKLAKEAAKARRVWENAKRLKADSDKVRQEALAQTERQRSEQAAKRAETDRQLEEAKRLKEEAERAKREAEIGAQARLEAEREKLAAEAERARAALEEAQRLKQEVEAQKKAAEEKAERERREQDEKIRAMREDSERRIREEQKKLEQSYAWQAEELTRLKKLKEEAEHNLAAERARLENEAEDARKRLAEAKRIQDEVEQARVESAREAEQRQQRQLELERRLRDEMQQKVHSERRKLETELARNAEELERARRERDAADLAKAAAAEEAEHIIQEYKQTHELLRQRQEAQLRAERERLETEASRLAQAIENADHEKAMALQIQREAEEHMAELKATRQENLDSTGKLQEEFASQVAALQAEIRQARDLYQAADQAQRDVEAAALANEYHLQEHSAEEKTTQEHFEQEIQAWLSEQDEVEQSDLQQQILASQRAHLQRIKQRAMAARKAAKDHDQSLIEELAAKLRES